MEQARQKKAAGDVRARRQCLTAGSPTPPRPCGLRRRPPTQNVLPVPGQRVLVPSYLGHGTEPFTDHVSRLTVAFYGLPD